MIIDETQPDLNKALIRYSVDSGVLLLEGVIQGICLGYLFGETGKDPALLQEPVYYRSPTGSGDYKYSRFSCALENPEPLYAVPQPAQQVVSKDRIREIFIEAGFTVKEGQTDLKPYVYEAAYALLNEAAHPARQAGAA